MRTSKVKQTDPGRKLRNILSASTLTGNSVRTKIAH
jgi:hypothetical protein